MPSTCAVQICFMPPPDALRRYFTSFYLTEIDLPAGETVTDHLHPEWGNLRFHAGHPPEAQPLGGVIISGTTFTATGPSSTALRFTLGATRIWGVGLMPLGWAKFMAEPAASLANAVVDGHSHAAFGHFAPLAATLFGERSDRDAEYARISAFFLAEKERPIPDEARILAIHAALVDPEVATVAALVDRTGGSPRTLERVCRRAFGFTPKLLLRRQRFMRSLAQFMLVPAMKWSGAMDGGYHDQAQFVRDFRQFMGMTPRQYAALPKPVLTAVMQARAQSAGAAVQTLDGPMGAAFKA